MIRAVAAPGAAHDPSATIILAATHLAPAFTIVPAVGFMLVLAWYWRRLARPSTPTSRRRLRRWSIVLMVVSMPVLIAGFSFIDGDVDHARYVLVWSGAFVLLMLVFLSAIVDAMNNVRLHAAQADEEAVEAAGELIEALKSRQASLAATKSNRAGNQPQPAAPRPSDQPEPGGR